MRSWTAILAVLALMSVDVQSRRSPQEFEAMLEAVNQIVKDTEAKWERDPNSKCLGGKNCCGSSPDKLCGIGEGNCNYDADCMAGLECGSSGNCDDIVVPMYQHWTIGGANFDNGDRCCQFTNRVLRYFDESQQV